MVKLVYQNAARIRSYGGEKIEFQAVSSELKPALSCASWLTSIGRAHRMPRHKRRALILPRSHSFIHSLALSISLVCGSRAEQSASPSPHRHPIHLARRSAMIYSTSLSS